MIYQELSRARQRRLLDVMVHKGLDAVVVGAARHVYYFSAHRPFWLQHAAFVLMADGKSLLICANSPAANAAADEITTYDASWAGTQRQEQPEVIAKQLHRLENLSRGNRR